MVTNSISFTSSSIANRLEEGPEGERRIGEHEG
jgi:hypothetical protein